MPGYIPAFTELENKLAANPRDGETQKQLMLEYNRALSLFAKAIAA
jgi:hypothetical protein